MSFQSDTHTRKVVNHIQFSATLLRITYRYNFSATLLRITYKCTRSNPEFKFSVKTGWRELVEMYQRYTYNFAQHCCESHTIFRNTVANHIQFFRNTVANHMKEKIIPNFLFKRSSDPSNFPAQNQRLLVRCGDVPTDTRDASALVRSRPLLYPVQHLRKLASTPQQILRKDSRDKYHLLKNRIALSGSYSVFATLSLGLRHSTTFPRVVHFPFHSPSSLWF
jgi:hypothetical protein